MPFTGPSATKLFIIKGKKDHKSTYILTIITLGLIRSLMRIEHKDNKDARPNQDSNLGLQSRSQNYEDHAYTGFCELDWLVLDALKAEGKVPQQRDDTKIIFKQ